MKVSTGAPQALRRRLLPPDEPARPPDLAREEAARWDLGPQLRAAAMRSALPAESRMAWAKSFCAGSAIFRRLPSFSFSIWVEFPSPAIFWALDASLVRAFRSALETLPVHRS